MTYFHLSIKIAWTICIFYCKWEIFYKVISWNAFTYWKCANWRDVSSMFIWIRRYWHSTNDLFSKRHSIVSFDFKKIATKHWIGWRIKQLYVYFKNDFCTYKLHAGKETENICGPVNIISLTIRDNTITSVSNLTFPDTEPNENINTKSHNYIYMDNLVWFTKCWKYCISTSVFKFLTRQLYYRKKTYFSLEWYLAGWYGWNCVCLLPSSNQGGLLQPPLRFFSGRS